MQKNPHEPHNNIDYNYICDLLVGNTGVYKKNEKTKNQYESLYSMYSGLVDAGFNEGQAMTLIIAAVTAVASSVTQRGAVEEKGDNK